LERVEVIVWVASYVAYAFGFFFPLTSTMGCVESEFCNSRLCVNIWLPLTYIMAPSPDQLGYFRPDAMCPFMVDRATDLLSRPIDAKVKSVDTVVSS